MTSNNRLHLTLENLIFEEQLGTFEKVGKLLTYAPRACIFEYKTDGKKTGNNNEAETKRSIPERIQVPRIYHTFEIFFAQDGTIEFENDRKSEEKN